MLRGSLMRIALFITSVTSAGSQAQTGPPLRPKPDKELEDLIHRLAALPPEFEADSLLALIDANRLPAGTIPATLDRIFLLAGRATLGSPLVAMQTKYEARGESVPALVASSSFTGKDRLSLRLRAIDFMKDRDLSHAVESFDTVEIPGAPLSCSDALMPWPSQYYKTLLALYQSSKKSLKPKIRETADQWLVSHLTLKHETQIAPIAHAISQLTVQKGVFDLAVAKFGLDLSRLDPSFRSYWATGREATDSLVSLTKRINLMSQPGEPLWRAFHTYHRSALGSQRCADTEVVDVERRLTELTAAVEKLSLPPDLVESFSSLAKVEPRRLDRSEPPFSLFGADSRVTDLSESYANLRFGPEAKRRQVAVGRRPDGLKTFLPLDQRTTVGWQNEAERHLRKIEEFAGLDHKDRLAAFIKITNSYNSLIEISPIGSPYLQSCISSYLSFLAASPILREQPLVWSLQFNMFLRRGTLDEHEQGFQLVRRMVRERGSQVMNTLLDIDKFNSNRSIL